MGVNFNSSAHLIDKFMLKLLKVEQKRFHVEVSQDVLDVSDVNPDFIDTVMTDGESCMFG